ncbi:MAG: cache domain-containing protein, partial [Rhodospirillales bacterium]|nr:cache domain-containing protein [Rhodospirillales bacterium]
MRALLRPKLTAKIVLLVLLPVLLLSAALAGSTLVVLRETARQQLDERLALNLGVAWEVLRGKGKDLRFDEGQLKAGDFALNDSTEVVDKVAALVGGVCSIFMGDERVSTTVRGDGGVRVVGSKLGQGPVYESLFTRHQGFRGEAMVLGDPYLTAYDPIFDKDGAILGSLVVGVRKAEFLTSVERTERL